MDNVFQMHQRTEVTRKSMTSKLVEQVETHIKAKISQQNSLEKRISLKQCHKLRLVSYWRLSVHNSESQSLWCKKVIERLQSFVSFIS